MKNIKVGNYRLQPALVKVMTEYNLTVNDIDNMDDVQFYEFCAQLDTKELNSLNMILENERWKEHIWCMLDRVEFVKNMKFA